MRIFGLGFGVLAAFGAAASPEKPTFTADIAPIFMENCVVCHRPGEIGPMSLLTYDEARPWAKSIQRNVAERKMPPWHATESVGAFVNERSLTQEEIDLVVRWVETGAPRGKQSDMPAAPEFNGEGWRLGEPDFIVEFKEVEVPADGPDRFENLPGKVALKEDKWVTAVEINPGNRSVVHHVIVFPIKGFEFDPFDSGWLGAWAAGTEPMAFPEGTGRLLKAGSNIIGDMHYHPSGTPAKDRTRVGLHFAEESDIEKQLVNLWIANDEFRIPPGAKNYEIRAGYTFLHDAFVTAFAPHMHYRGKDFTYTAHYPGGQSETLLRVDNYDFNWQTYYRLEDRHFVPAGTRIEAVAHYDNSADNPVNPDPTQELTFGDESYDEMMIGFLDYVVAEGTHPWTRAEARRHFLVKYATAHPGEVFAIGNGGDDFDPAKGTALHLPASGDGTIVLGVDGTTAVCRVFDIAWDGEAFSAKVQLTAERVAGLEGTVTNDYYSGNLVIMDGERRIPIEGPRATPQNIALTSDGD